MPAVNKCNIILFKILSKKVCAVAFDSNQIISYKTNFALKTLLFKFRVILSAQISVHAMLT